MVTDIGAGVSGGFAPSRRRFLQGLSMALGLTMIDQVAMGSVPTGFFQSKGLAIGLELYTLGEQVGHDLDATFTAVAGIGYREIELPNLLGHAPRDIRTAADRAGLAIRSLHLPLFGMGGATVSLASDPARIAETLDALGAQWAVAPILLLPSDFRPAAGESFQTAISRSVKAAGADIWKRTAAALNERAALLKPLDVRVGYHNHNLEFAPIGATTGWNILRDETAPDLVSFEVDIGWVAAAGLDPVAFLESVRGRVSQFHIKDIAAGNTANFNIVMSPTEVGAGVLSWRRILPAAYRAGARHFYVEQEPPFAIPREESARRSFDYLLRLSA